MSGLRHALAARAQPGELPAQRRRPVVRHVLLGRSGRRPQCAGRDRGGGAWRGGRHGIGAPTPWPHALARSGDAVGGAGAARPDRRLVLVVVDVLGGAGTVAPASTFGNAADFPPEDAGFHNGSFWYIGKGDDFDNKLYQVPITYTGNVPSFSGTPTAYQLSASGSTSGMAFGDIAIHRDTGILYGSTTPGSGGLFFTLDMNTLNTSATNPVNVITSGNPISLQLAFSEDFSTLYGQEYRFDPNDPTNPALTSGAWYTVDTTSGTYNSISVTTSPGMRDLAGVAAVPEPGTFLLATVGFAVALAWNRKPVLKAARST